VDGGAEQTTVAALRKEDIEALKMLAMSSEAKVAVTVQAELEPESLLALSSVLGPAGGQVISLVASQTVAVDLRYALDQAGVDHNLVRVYTGDPMRQLALVNGPVDLLFLCEGVNYVQALEEIRGCLRPGSIVIAHRGAEVPEFIDAVAYDDTFETTLLGNKSELSVSLVRN
jgi:predicted O-methyltransferase YrrM